jgi:hypothetical protein
MLTRARGAPTGPRSRRSSKRLSAPADRYRSCLDGIRTLSGIISSTTETDLPIHADRRRSHRDASFGISASYRIASAVRLAPAAALARHPLEFSSTQLIRATWEVRTATHAAPEERPCGPGSLTAASWFETTEKSKDPHLGCIPRSAADEAAALRRGLERAPPWWKRHV